MEKIIIKFGDIKIKKQKLHQYKRPFSIDDIDVNKIVVSNKVSFDKNRFKYFTGYKDTKKILPLFIFLPKMSAYRRNFDKTKCMIFLIKDNKLLEKYNEIQEKVRNINYKEFDSNPVCNEKYIKTKIKDYNKKVNTNFNGNKMPIESLECNCLSVILLNSFYKKDNKYYPQMFLEECKYVVKGKRIDNYIINIIILLMMQKFLLILMKKIC